MHRVVIWDEMSWQILDIDISWQSASIVFFLVENASLQWNDVIFWTYPTVLVVLLLTFYPLIHITDDYLSKNVIGLIFCEITDSLFYNAVSVSRHIKLHYRDRFFSCVARAYNVQSVVKDPVM